MNYLGIDYGSKRVGISFAEEGSLAFPLKVIPNTKDLLEEVKKVCEDKKPDMLVFGDSKNYAMQDNPIMESMCVFAGELSKETGLPLHYELEFLTSVEAERFQGKTDMSDAAAASIILQSFLDKRKNNIQ